MKYNESNSVEKLLRIANLPNLNNRNHRDIKRKWVLRSLEIMSNGYVIISKNNLLPLFKHPDKVNDSFFQSFELISEFFIKNISNKERCKLDKNEIEDISTDMSPDISTNYLYKKTRLDYIESLIFLTLICTNQKKSHHYSKLVKNFEKTNFSNEFLKQNTDWEERLKLFLNTEDTNNRKTEKTLQNISSQLDMSTDNSYYLNFIHNFCYVIMYPQFFTSKNNIVSNETEQLLKDLSNLQIAIEKSESTIHILRQQPKQALFQKLKNTNRQDLHFFIQNTNNKYLSNKIKEIAKEIETYTNFF